MAQVSATFILGDKAFLNIKTSILRHFDREVEIKEELDCYHSQWYLLKTSGISKLSRASYIF